MQTNTSDTLLLLPPSFSLSLLLSPSFLPSPFFLHSPSFALRPPSLHTHTRAAVLSHLLHDLREVAPLTQQLSLELCVHVTATAAALLLVVRLTVTVTGYSVSLQH